MSYLLDMMATFEIYVGEVVGQSKGGNIHFVTDEALTSLPVISPSRSVRTGEARTAVSLPLLALVH
jgi:hypothetical protein